MRDVAYIAWGSLVWDPRTLDMEGEWAPSGPRLPIEFSRVARDGRLTLIVDRADGRSVPTWVAASPVDLDGSIVSLAEREGCRAEWIGHLDRGGERDSSRRWPEQVPIVDLVRPWLWASEWRAAVWTALPSTFRVRTGRAFSVAAARDYLESLRGETRSRALEYIRRAPSTTSTPLRDSLLKEPVPARSAARTGSGPRSPG